MALTAGRTVLMIMVDALRHDYINAADAPFLQSLAERGVHGSLAPSFGFEPDAAYLAGLDPEECDGGAQFWRRPGERVFHLTRLFGLLDRVPSRGWRRNVRRATRLVAQLMAKDAMTRKLASSVHIPYAMLAQFSMPMKRLASDPGFAPSPTVFDVVRGQGGCVYFHGYPAYPVHTRDVVSRYLRDGHRDRHLAFLFLGDLDAVGHRFGPDSAERRRVMREVDDGIRKICGHAREHYPEVEILVFGDHGMAEVRRHVDLREAIGRAGLDAREDAYFLDSTFARFWVADATRRARLVESLDAHAGGHVISQAERRQYRIEYPHNYFGDVIYAVDDHVLVHPSFYCLDPAPRGMHGYLPGCRDNESAFVLVSGRISQAADAGRVDMRRVFPTVVDLLGLLGTVAIPHDLESLLT